MNNNQWIDVMKERFYYVISENGNYCAYSVNMPLIIQVKTFEEMKQAARELMAGYIKDLQEIILLDEPFEFVPEPPKPQQ